MTWNTFDEVLFDLVDAYERAVRDGYSEELAIAKASSILAFRRDDLINPQISFGITTKIIYGNDRR